MQRGKDIKVLDKNIRISAILDISEIKEREKEILQLARYDHLTGIPNRLMLKEIFSYMSKRIKRENHYGALLFIDLDNFKMINDINNSKGSWLSKEGNFIVYSKKTSYKVKYIENLAKSFL